jgi:hypothetical protein
VVEALRMALNTVQKHAGRYNFIVKSIYVHVVEALLDPLLNYFNVGECVSARIA